MINEIDCTVTAFDYDPDRGTLTEIQTVPTMPIAVEPRHSTAEVVVHPSGKFLYGSNRGHDSLAVFAIEPGTGRLKLVEYQPTGGKTPRNFAVDPTGSYVLAENHDSDTIVVFRVDPETGALDPTGQVVEVPSPVLREVRPDCRVTWLYRGAWSVERKAKRDDLTPHVRRSTLHVPRPRFQRRCSLFSWKWSRGPISLLGQIHRHLPDVEFLVVLKCHCLCLHAPRSTLHVPRSTLHAPRPRFQRRCSSDLRSCASIRPIRSHSWRSGSSCSGVSKSTRWLRIRWVSSSMSDPLAMLTMVEEFLRVLSTLTLSNVRRDRRSRPTDLSCHPEQLFSWKWSRGLIDCSAKSIATCQTSSSR